MLDVGFKLVVASSANLLGEDIGSQPEEATSLWCIDSLGKSSGQSSSVVFSVESNVDFLRKLKVNLSSDLLWSFVVFGIIALDFSFELSVNLGTTEVWGNKGEDSRCLPCLLEVLGLKSSLNG